MKRIGDLKVENFEGLEGEMFSLGHFRVELLQVHRGPETPSRFRQQFSLIFNCPDEFESSHADLELSHEKVGSHRLFVSKVLGYEEPMNLEIVFN
ncbi:DUF6916 family protein [Flexibacterium corallicola]|uniref:DUF6916 family protein n=1 Tax=Flexibacterium corallicola TaxID=3037259 RepID=UPI00286F2830|nr:hypothetical protein [Pseudovibrio sp. M1P-2-3]